MIQRKESAECGKGLHAGMMASWHDCVDGSTIYQDRECKKNIKFRGGGNDFCLTRLNQDLESDLCL